MKKKLRKIGVFTIKKSTRKLSTLGYLGSLQRKFSDVIEVDRSNIITRADLFQGRQVAFSQETVDKILREGFDKSQEPIAVWQDPASGKYIVISGHSRFHASELLFNKGDKSLKKMPVKVFNGSLEEAQDYAILESNRSGTAEGLKSDLTAYRLAIKKGKSKDYLLSIFKTEARVRLLQDLSILNPKGKFMMYLGEEAEKSFPYLTRNAQWVGILRKLYPNLTDSHENELFDYFYESKNNLSIKKENIFNLVEKKATSLIFDREKPLNLKNSASTSVITDSVNEVIDQVNKDLDDLNEQRARKEVLISRAKNEGKDAMVKKFTDERSLINAAILRKLEERDRLEKQKRELERSTVFDLFNPPAPVKSVAPKVSNTLRLQAMAVKVKLQLIAI